MLTMKLPIFPEVSSPHAFNALNMNLGGIAVYQLVFLPEVEVWPSKVQIIQAHLPSTYPGMQRPSIVIDGGSCSTKLGFSGNQQVCKSRALCAQFFVTAHVPAAQLRATSTCH